MIETFETLATGGMTIPVSWALGAILSLAGVVGAVAGVCYKLLLRIIEGQTERINNQEKEIVSLKFEIEKLQAGCGIGACIWKR